MTDLAALAHSRAVRKAEGRTLTGIPQKERGTGTREQTGAHNERPPKSRGMGSFQNCLELGAVSTHHILKFNMGST